MNVLPYLRGTGGGLNAQVLFPFDRTVSFLTEVKTFADASEQRWPTRPPLTGFDIPMSSLALADRNAWLTFFQTQKGRFNQDLQITLGINTYDNLTLMSDALQQTNTRTVLFEQKITLRQVRNIGYAAPTPGTVFPTLSFGTTCEQPFVQEFEYLTTVNDNPYGPRFRFANYGGGVSGFPTSGFKHWTLQYPVVNNTDIQTLEGFFLSQQGMSESFSFTDPITGVTTTHVRFDQDSMVIKAIAHGLWSTSLKLLQTNNS